MDGASGRRAAERGVGDDEGADLRSRLDAERRIAELTRRFLSAEAADIDDLIRSELESVGRLAGADRAFLFSPPELRRNQPCFFEWLRDDEVPSTTPTAGEAELYQGFSKRLLAGETIAIPDVSALPDALANEREAMRGAGIRSYLLVPALSRGSLMGILGVHCCRCERRWTKHELTLLRLVADLFTSALLRKRNERALRESEARFRALAENSQDGICELSASGEILYASPAFERLVGAPCSELEGRSLFDLSHPGDAGAVADLIDAALCGDPDAAIVFRMVRLGVWVEVEATARGFATGSVDSRLVAVLRDVSEREQDRRALERQVAGEQRIAELSRFFLGLDPTRTGEAVHDKLAVAAALAEADRSWLFSFDPTREEPLRSCVWSARGFAPELPGLEDESRFSWAAEVLRDGDVLSIERVDALPAAAANEARVLGDRGVRSFLAIPLLSGRRLVGLMGFEVVSREQRWSPEQITLLRLVGEIFVSALRREQAEHELERSRSQLLQSQKMEAVGTLAGGIAHDFNNHLAVMLGNARWIHESLATRDPEVVDALGDVQRSAEHCAQLTRSLLAFSRRSPVTIQAIEVGEILGAASDLVRPLLPSSIAFRVETDLPGDKVRADATQLRQVLVNLVVNARDAMPAGGVLRLGARSLQLSPRRAAAIGLPRAGHYVEIRVADDGEGMCEEVQARVFEPFFTTKEPGRGTGLGLATAYGIVQQCGGSIEVESRPGEGTTFRVLLPISPDEVDETMDAVPADPGPGTERLLLVEDEPAVRRLVARSLRARGFSVVEAADGVAALEVAGDDARDFDLLIADLVMPRMGGVELATKLQVARPELRVLFLSGHAAPEAAAGSDAVRHARFLQKPFRTDDLLREVRVLLEAWD